MNTLTEVKERPILFSGPMVQAILEGRKTQTRRVIKLSGRGDCTDLTGALPEIRVKYQFLRLPNGSEYGPVSCPYNCDRLWVRETWANDLNDFFYRADGAWEDNKSITWKPSIHMPRTACRLILEVASVRIERLQDISEEDAIAEGIETITDLAGENLYFKRYGAPVATPDSSIYQNWCDNPVESFMSLWDSINAKTCPWDSSPWVWVVSFKKQEV